MLVNQCFGNLNDKKCLKSSFSGKQTTEIGCFEKRQKYMTKIAYKAVFWKIDRPIWLLKQCFGKFLKQSNPTTVTQGIDDEFSPWLGQVSLGKTIKNLSRNEMTSYALHTFERKTFGCLCLGCHLEISQVRIILRFS